MNLDSTRNCPVVVNWKLTYKVNQGMVITAQILDQTNYYFWWVALCVVPNPHDICGGQMMLGLMNLLSWIRVRRIDERKSR